MQMPGLPVFPGSTCTYYQDYRTSKDSQKFDSPLSPAYHALQQGGTAGKMSTSTTPGLFYTSYPGASTRLAQVVGLTTTAFLAGNTFAASFGSVPAFLQAPAPLLAKQIVILLNSGKFVNPLSAIIGTGIFSFFAYSGR
jgi:hypothetical protein